MILVIVMIVSMAVTVIMIAVILISAVVAFMIVVPFMTVFNAAMWAFPITVIETLAIGTRPDPASTSIGWPAPIAFMPAIVTSGGIPVATDPNEFGPGLCRDDGDNIWFGGRANTDPNRYLRVSGNTEQKHGRQ